MNRQSTIISRGLHELHPCQLVPTLAAALVSGTVGIMISVSIVTMVFNGQLNHYMPAGVGIVLFSMIALRVVTALLSSFPGIIADVDALPAAILGTIVASISNNMPAGATSSETFLTITCAIALTSVLTGLFLFLLGQFRVGELIRLIPYPVIGGFLAGTGWLLVKGAIFVMTDLPINLTQLTMLFGPETLLRWFPGFTFAILLLGIYRRWDHSMILPASIGGAIGLFSFFPKPVLGGLLLFIGFSFLADWLYDGWAKLSKPDYILVLLILIIIGTVGFLQGIGVGFLAAMQMFVFEYTRKSAIRYVDSGADRRSQIVRSPSQSQHLSERGIQIYILGLRDFIFFGTAKSPLDRICRRLHDPHSLPLRFVMLDFKNVIGLDASAVRSFIKIKQIAAENQLKLIFIGIEPTVLNRLERGECKIIGDPICLSFLDMNQGLEWCEEQIFKLDHVEALKTANVREHCSSSSGKPGKGFQSQSNPDYQQPATAGFIGR